MPAAAQAGRAGARAPRLTVIIPTYNSDASLAICLDALRRQTLPKGLARLVVVDNGSTDVDAAMRRSHPEVTWLHEPTPGSYAARNRALQDVRTPAIAFTDADTVPDPAWLERGLAALDAAPDAGLVAGRVQVVAADPGRPTTAELYDIVFGFPQDLHVSVSKFAVTANLFTRRRVVDAVGPFDATLKSLGDRDWGNRVHDAGYPLVYADDAIVLHPARATGRELRRKARRTTGGTYGFLRKRWAGLPFRARQAARLRHWLGLLGRTAVAPPVRVAKAVRRGDVPGGRALALTFLYWSIMLARLGETVRLAFGGEPLR